ncbi:MAG: hypothetical protein HY720_15585 [Planctomycetes bacterium]|nr:hypothetical protein [Planctomycetota bacterium]
MPRFAPRLVLLVAVLAAPAAGQSVAIDRFNEILRQQWDAIGRPEAERILPGQLQGLAGQSSGVLSIEKLDGISLDLKAAPGVERMDARGVRFRIPLSGGWTIRARAHMKLEVRIFGIPIVHRAPVDVVIRELSIVAAGTIATRSPEEPKVTNATSRIAFRLSLSSPDPLFGFAARWASWLFERVLRGPVLALLSGFVREKFLPLAKGQPEIIGRGGPAMVDPGPTDLARRAQEIDSTIQRDLLPYGTLLVATYSSPNPGEGTVTAYHDFGDSAIWTGHYLMSQCFRFRATGDARAKAGATRALGGIDDLFAVTGGDGVLARAVAPASSPEGAAKIAQGPPLHRRTIRGVDTVGWGADFISRDQYTGVMAGMGFADLTFESDPAVRGIVRKNVTAALDHMLRNNWIVYFSDGRFSVSFATKFDQQLAFLALGRRVDPGRFDAPFQYLAPTAELVWFPLWSETWDQHKSYYKFNLDHTTLALLMTLDQDPARWREYHRGLRILRRALDHHENAWFQTVEMLVDPASRPSLAPRTEIALRLWCQRPERAVSLDPQRIALLPRQTYVNKLSGESDEIARHPVPIDLRGPTDFLWQRSPFGLGVEASPRTRYCGVDLVLPYWIGRHLGLYP